jgi:hypothetical protein
MKHELVTAALWAIAIVVTFLMIDDRTIITKLGPVFAICAIGSVVNVRAARMGPGRKSAAGGE